MASPPPQPARDAGAAGEFARKPRASYTPAARGTSVSALVERYLDRLTREPAAARGDEPPVLARLRGVLRGVDPEEHRRHLERKYGHGL